MVVRSITRIPRPTLRKIEKNTAQRKSIQSSYTKEYVVKGSGYTSSVVSPTFSVRA